MHQDLPACCRRCRGSARQSHGMPNCGSVPVCQELPRAGGPCSNPPPSWRASSPQFDFCFIFSSLLNLVACPDSPARGVYNGVSLNAQLLCTNPPKSSKPSGCTFSMPFPICFSIPSQALPLTDATPSGNPLNQARFSHHFPPPTSPLILDSTARELWQLWQ